MHTRRTVGVDVIEMQARIQTLEAQTLEIAQYLRELGEAFTEHLAANHGYVASSPGSTDAKYWAAVERQRDRRERKRLLRIVRD